MSSAPMPSSFSALGRSFSRSADLVRLGFAVAPEHGCGWGLSTSPALMPFLGVGAVSTNLDRQILAASRPPFQEQISGSRPTRQNAPRRFRRVRVASLDLGSPMATRRGCEEVPNRCFSLVAPFNFEVLNFGDQKDRRLAALEVNYDTGSARPWLGASTQSPGSIRKRANLVRAGGCGTRGAFCWRSAPRGVLSLRQPNRASCEHPK